MFFQHRPNVQIGFVVYISMKSPFNTVIHISLMVPNPISFFFSNTHPKPLGPGRLLRQRTSPYFPVPLCACVCLCALLCYVCSLHGSRKKKKSQTIRTDPGNLNTTRKKSTKQTSRRSSRCTSFFRIFALDHRTLEQHIHHRGLEETVRTHHTVSVHTLGCWSPLLAGKISFLLLTDLLLALVFFGNRNL